MKSFSRHPQARDGQTLIFVQVSQLSSDLDSDFTIQAHLGANSQDFMENTLLDKTTPHNACLL